MICYDETLLIRILYLTVVTQCIINLIQLSLKPIMVIISLR